MATPIGHGVLGYAVYAACSPPSADPAVSDRRALALCVVLAIAPDFDFLPGVLLGQPARFHQGISHSFVFAVLLAVPAALWCAPTAAVRGRYWMMFMVAYASHLVMDLFGPDGRLPYGIPLFWPLSSATFQSPITLLLGMRHAEATTSSTSEWLTGILTLRNILALVVELLFVVPILGGALVHRQRRVQRVLSGETH